MRTAAVGYSGRTNHCKSVRWRLALACALAATMHPALDLLADRADRSLVRAKAQSGKKKATEPQPPPIPLLSRAEILATDAKRLERLGRHVIVGYHSYSDIKTLVEKRAIAGVFLTDHNVRWRTTAAVKADIDALQNIRKAQGLSPLVIAADQEGGAVSRLSPPLKRQPSISQILAPLKDDAARQAAIEKFAAIQAEELKRMGVTLNFAPVVDLRLYPSNRSDGETRLRLRAFSSDAYLVAKVAGWYCEGLAKAGLMCTLKHFPGLGRVKRDTHAAAGEIKASEGELEVNDWYPFRRLMGQPNVATMLGHVRVPAMDPKMPASYSDAIVRELLRKRWRHSGLLITDDFSMDAITRSAEGVGRASVKALRAGVDLILVSFSERHYDAAMSALIRADEEGVFDLADSQQRRAHR